MDISETKNIKAVLRKEMKERLKGLSEGRKRKLDEALCRQLLSLPEVSAPRTVYAYPSLSWGPDTWEILKALLFRGFRLALPRVEGREMRFYFLPDLKELSQSSMKIWEPKADAVPADDPEALVLVPGMAFSREGARLGKGGGFFYAFSAGRNGKILNSICVLSWGNPSIFAHLARKENPVCINYTENCMQFITFQKNFLFRFR